MDMVSLRISSMVENLLKNVMNESSFVSSRKSFDFFQMNSFSIQLFSIISGNVQNYGIEIFDNFKVFTNLFEIILKLSHSIYRLINCFFFCSPDGGV